MQTTSTLINKNYKIYNIHQYTILFFVSVKMKLLNFGGLFYLFAGLQEFLFLASLYIGILFTFGLFVFLAFE